MNKLLIRISRIFVKIICVITACIIFSYFGLWIYVTNSVPKELKLLYDESVIVELSDNQYNLIWFTLTGNKNYEFKWYPFIFDTIFEKKEYNLVGHIAFHFINSNEKYRRSYRYITWNVENGLIRYIKYNNNYKKFLSIIINSGYMGNGIYGFEDASKYYFSKTLEYLNDRELLSIVLLYISSSRFSVESKNSENRINEIIEKYFE
jgi:hypothetical protein